jgi:hypothetical protein
MALRFLLPGIALTLFLAPGALADKLQITSNPPGAAVEI